MKTLYVKIERYQKDYKEFASITTSIDKDFNTVYRHITDRYACSDNGTISSSLKILPVYPQNYTIECNHFDTDEEIIQKIYDETECKERSCVKYVYGDQFVVIYGNPKTYSVSKSEISGALTLLVLTECNTNNKNEFIIDRDVHDVMPMDTIKFLLQSDAVSHKDTFIFGDTEIVVDLIADTVSTKIVKSDKISGLSYSEPGFKG